MYRRRNCMCYMNNNQNSYKMNQENTEDPVLDYNVYNCNKNEDDYMNCSECGFYNDEDNMFPSNPMFGQSYVPIQYMDKTFIPSVGLRMGTIFPELVSPYSPGQSMREIEYLRTKNMREVSNQ